MREFVVTKLPIYQRNEDGVIVKLELELGSKISLSDAAADHLIAEGYVEELKTRSGKKKA